MDSPYAHPLYYLLCYAWGRVQEQDTTRLATLEDVRGDVRSAYRRLDGVSRTRLKRNTFGQIQLGGNRRLYQFLLSVCRLLYESSVVDENTGRTAFRDFRRDKATMWALFEEFVTGFYEREQSVYRVNPGGRRVAWADKGWATEEDRTRIPVMEADVILDSPERRIILDTKYYKDALARGRGSGTGKLHSGNLYQLLAYLRNRQAPGRPGPSTKAFCCTRRSASRCGPTSASRASASRRGRSTSTRTGGTFTGRCWRRSGLTG